MTPHDSTTDDRILQSLPEDIHAAILTYASESALTPHAVIEGALKHFLDLDTSLSKEPTSAAEETSFTSHPPTRSPESGSSVCREDRDPW